MLFLCYPVLVSLALAAPGISLTCYDYCKTNVSEKMNDASLECECADFIDTVINSDESSMIILDDTGVYFVPAETQSFQGQFSSRPFFISNPGKSIPKSTNRINREFVTLKESLNDPVPSQSAHIEIYERRETISHTSINEDLRKSPLYLDLDIQESTDKDKEAVQQYTLIEDTESTERDLVQCLDFQIIHFTRKYGFNEKFREFWSARNLDKYEHWSDLDIEGNMQKWCSKPESIVKHSLQEIKQGLPQKTPDTISHNNESKNQFSGTENLTTLVTTNNLYNVTEPSATYNQSTEEYTAPPNITETYDTTYNPTEDWPFISVTSLPTLKESNNYETQHSSSLLDAASDATSIAKLDTLIKETPSEPTVKVNQPIKSTASDSETDLDTMASEDVFYSYVPTATEDKIVDGSRQKDNKTTRLNNPTTPLITDESLETPNQTTIEVNQSNKITASDLEIDLDTMASEDILYPYVPTVTKPKIVDDSHQLDKKTTELDNPNPTTPLITEDSMETPSKTTIEVNQPTKIRASHSETDLAMMASEDVLYPYVPTVITAKIMNDAHQLYNKTTGIHNGTTPLSIDESLERQNAVTDVTILAGETLNDFNTSSHDTSQVSVTETYPELREMYEEKDIRIPKIITKECHNNKIQTIIDGFEELPNNDYKDSTSRSDIFENGNHDIKLDITGRLYFVSKKQLVPVRFVQTDTGTISLGVDGPALCDKLVLSKIQKSQLLTILCEYVQNNMYPDKNSSPIQN